jgi:hypothetical protein
MSPGQNITAVAFAEARSGHAAPTKSADAPHSIAILAFENSEENRRMLTSLFIMLAPLVLFWMFGFILDFRTMQS